MRISGERREAGSTESRALSAWRLALAPAAADGDELEGVRVRAECGVHGNSAHSWKGRRAACGREEFLP